MKSQNVFVVGRHRSKIAIADKAGAQAMTLADLSSEMMRSFDVVIEASGSQSGFDTALDLVRPRGTMVLKSTFHGNASWPPSRVVVDEIAIAGSRCGRLKPALDLIESEAVNTDDLIAYRFSLSDGVEAMRRAGGSGVLKVLISP